VPAAKIDGVLVQSMQYGIGEVLVGYRRDREAGPLVLVGVGGTAAELGGGCALRLAPVSVESALEMVREVPALATIRGFRNRPAGDLQAVARVVHTLSLLACIEAPRVLEAEINPLIVRTDGVVAVDARIRIAEAVGD
jgi:acyl-CoA synthetase (NDP forming)